jgi:signal transduction histidine kinase
MPRARREPGDRGIAWVSFVVLLLATPAAGLDPGTALTQYGHTAWRVRERADRAGVALTFATEPGAGTTIIASWSPESVGKA